MWHSDTYGAYYLVLARSSRLASLSGVGRSALSTPPVSLSARSTANKVILVFRCEADASSLSRWMAADCGEHMKARVRESPPGITSWLR